MVATVRQLWQEGLNIIEERDYCNPSLDVQLILAHILGCDRIGLHSQMDRAVEPEDAGKFYRLVQKRNTGYPLQYLTHSQEFMGHDFYVQEGVLIPRPDTETLVEKAIEEINLRYGAADPVTILDLGTGSGAIALSLALAITNSYVTAVDISDTAIETATINRDKLGVKNADIIKGDIFGNLNTVGRKYHAVVSNPPYIEGDIIGSLQREVSLYEPRLALDGGRDGLDYYRRIVSIFPSITHYGGSLFVEIGWDQGESVRRIFESTGIFKDINIYKDLGGRDRVVSGFL